MIFRWLEAGRLPHRAIDVVHDAALAADHVMVVVADASSCSRARPWARCDARCRPHRTAEHVVDRLRRHAAKLGAHLVDDDFSGRVRMFREHLEHGDARPGDPKAGCPQQLGRRLRMRHEGHAITFSGISQESTITSRLGPLKELDRPLLDELEDALGGSCPRRHRG